MPNNAARAITTDVLFASRPGLAHFMFGAASMLKLLIPCPSNRPGDLSLTSGTVNRFLGCRRRDSLRPETMAISKAQGLANLLPQGQP